MRPIGEIENNDDIDGHGMGMGMGEPLPCLVPLVAAFPAEPARRVPASPSAESPRLGQPARSADDDPRAHPTERVTGYAPPLTAVSHALRRTGPRTLRDALDRSLR